MNSYTEVVQALLEEPCEFCGGYPVDVELSDALYLPVEHTGPPCSHLITVRKHLEEALRFINGIEA